MAAPAAGKQSRHGRRFSVAADKPNRKLRWQSAENGRAERGRFGRLAAGWGWQYRAEKAGGGAAVIIVFIGKTV